MNLDHTNQNLVNDKYLPSLPTIIRTRSGIEFDPSEDVWIYRDNVTCVNINFKSINGTTHFFNHCMKTILLWYVENRSSNHLLNVFDRMRHLINFLSKYRTEPISMIAHIDIINYKSELNEKNSWYLSVLAGFLKKWIELKIPGVDEEIKYLLEKIRIKGNKKGMAVTTMDSKLGAFTDIELQAICSALNEAYAKELINIDKFILAWLFILMGHRPIQYASLKVCDFIVDNVGDGTKIYALRIPRAKQRNTLTRDQFKNRIIIPQIGALLIAYTNLIKENFSEKIPDPNQAPLFPMKKRTEAAPQDEFYFHQTANSIGNSICKTLEVLNIFSERTGEKMHINATRFRYTIGTRAAAEGHGSLIIAELLDHTDTQNVGVYVQSSPGMIERIDRAMAMYMAPMAQAFAGTLIIDEAEAIRGNDPRSRIVDPLFDTSFKPIGNCGNFNFCGFAAPIACYTCRNFQPWLDGPHEAVLVHLLSERERLKSSADMRIASINDRAIFAVAQVITQCEQVRAEMAEGGDLG